MSIFKVEFSMLQPLPTGGYGDFIDVTEDVIESGLGNIKKALETNEYDVGTLKFNNIKLAFRNENGHYSRAIDARSIFPEKRDRTIVKISWNINEDGADCGNAFCGLTFMDPEVRVFKGLIEDNATKFDTSKQTTMFSILGIESITQKVDTPFASLTGSDDVEALLFKCLNQTSITEYFTVDAGNINVNYNFTPDSIASLEDRPVLDTINELLFLSGAVLFVDEEDVMHVRSRTVDATSSYTFYSPSSDLGIENIINISKYTEGLNRTFNFWKWTGTTVKVSFIDSIEQNGRRVKEISSDLVTNGTTQLAILNSLLTEFGFPKVEYELTTYLTTEVIQLMFLNKVNVDYPADYLPVQGQEFSRYGRAKYGVGRYARSVSSLFISITDDWKIINKVINSKNQTVTFKLREA